MDGIGKRITNEILTLAGTMYRLFLQPVIILALIGFAVFCFHVYVICEKASSIPFVHKLCPGREINALSHLPLENLTHNTVALAETLSNADASVPMHCVGARLAFTEARAEIIHSDIQPGVRNNMVSILDDLKKLMDKGAEQSSSMLVAYSKALDAAKIHTEFLLDDLSKPEITNNYQSQQLQIESSDMKQTDSAIEVFNNYTININAQIDNALHKTQDFDITLKLVIGKIEILQDLVKKGKRIDNLALDSLTKDSWWKSIFGKDVTSIRKHQRNIKTLGEFNDFIRKLSKNVGETIANLLLFKASAIYVKEAAADLSTLAYKSPARQLQIVKASIDRLVQAQHAFEKKLEQGDRKQNVT